MTVPGTPPTRFGRRGLALALGIVISGVALWWALRGVAWGDIRARLGAVHPWTLLAAVAVATTTFPIRAWRWRYLLRTDDGRTLPWPALWHPVAIGFMANNILPARLGEIVRCYTVSRLAPVKVTASLSSVAVERVFDALTLAALFAIALLGPAVPAGIGIAGKVKFVGLAGVVALLVLTAAAFRPEWAERTFRRLLPKGRVADRLAALLRGLLDGLTALHDPRRLAAVVAGSALLWVVNAWGFALAFAAFGLPGDLGTALIVQTFVVFAVAAPSTPGYVGVLEGAVVLALSLYGVPKDAALAAAATYHATTFIPIIVLGAWSLARTGLSLGELRSASTAPAAAP
ncbi:MAG TPA: lysylphosphatidylglycerol synthase transmembrane domain-containing protein [Gemmatimonadales bacterium]|nr:lysylphosphatidylglycerol synthase transmembrane domain-containing protein [Gemmatimonadales bacterium]